MSDVGAWGRSVLPQDVMAGRGEADVDDEEKIARGVARGIARHEAARAEAQSRQLLGCMLLLALFVGGFVVLVSYG